MGISLLSWCIFVQSRAKHWPRCVQVSCQKISAPRKSSKGWPLTFWPKFRHVAPSRPLPFEYEVRSLYTENIHSYRTRNNGLILSLAIWSNPLTNVKWHSDSWPTVTNLPIRLSTNFMTFIPSLTFTELWVVSMEHLQLVWLASRERLPFRTPGSVPHFGTC